MTANFSCWIQELARSGVTILLWQCVFVSIHCGRAFTYIAQFTGTVGVVFVWQLHLPRQLVLQLPMQSVYITTKVVSSNPVHDEVYSIQHYVITFVSGRWFSPGTLFSSSNKTDRQDITEILLKVALITINQINHTKS